MALQYIEQWLGCLDLRSSIALWQIPRALIEDGTPYVLQGSIDDAFVWDGYEFEYRMRDAFLVVFALTPGIVVIDDIPYPVYFYNPALFDLVTMVYIFSFNPDLSNAPCTQQIFP